ncbi:MAG: DUF58 domain-containing protein, partial [Oscillospiraceae bacterium]
MLKSRIIYTLLLLGAIGFYLFYGEYLAFVALAFVVSLPFFLYAITLITSRKIVVKFADCKTIAQKLTSTEAQVEVDNESMLHIVTAKLTIVSETVFSNDKLKEMIFIPINANQITTIKTGVVSKYCGDVKITLKNVKLYDFLSLTSHTKRLNKSLKVAVLPNVYEINANPNIVVAPDDESHSYSTTKSGDDASQVFDYHEYHEGDKVKNIHWKLSTKLDKLMVKEFSLPISSAVCIALELGDCENKANQLAQIDAQIETFTSISSWLFAKGVPHETQWYHPVDSCAVKMKLASVDDLFLSIEHLYNTKPHLGNMLLDEIASRTIKPKISHMIYITNSIDNSALKSIFELNESIGVTIVYIKEENYSVSDELKQALTAVEINLIEVNTST